MSYMTLMTSYFPYITTLPCKILMTTLLMLLPLKRSNLRKKYSL